MFRRSQREPDLEDNHEGHARRETLYFDHPSWIRDHHIHNLITKITKPDDSWFDVLLAPNSKGNQVSDHNRGRHENETATDEQQLGLRNQPVKEGTGATDAPLGGREQSYRINFSELQRLRLRQLQHKLVQHTVDLRYDGMEPSGRAEDLREYGKSNMNFSSYILLAFY